MHPENIFAGCVLGFGFVLLASGCASAPRYIEPSVPESAQAAFTHRIPGQVNGDLPGNWWQLYRDHELELVVEEALAANTDLRVAAANLDRARAIYRAARGGRVPTTSISGAATQDRSDATMSGGGSAAERLTYSGGIDVSYELDLFGRVRRQIEAARGDSEVVAAALDAAKVAVVAETTRAYADACAYGQALDVARDDVELAQRTYDLVEAREQHGAASRLDIELAASALAQARAALPDILASRSTAILELTALMGRVPADAPQSVQACHMPLPFAENIPVGDGRSLLARRPDVRQAERQLAADTARIGVAVAELYPSVTFAGRAQYLHDGAMEGQSGWSMSLGPLVSWSFPNLIEARSRVEQAEAQSAASLARFDGVVLGALKETEQALATYALALERRDALNEALKRAEEGSRLAGERYRAGSIAYMDLIVVQKDLVSARAQVTNVEQRIGSARVDLFRAMGGGWATGRDE